MKQLITFFTLAYLISFTIWFPLYSHVLGIKNWRTLPYHHGLGALGPLIASVVTTLIYEKKEGVKQLIKKCFQVRPGVYLAVAMFSPFLLVLIASVINYIANKTPVNFYGLFTIKEFPELNFFTFFIYNLIFFGFGEETGWRGFALPRLQSNLNALSSSIVLTLFWAFWHLPLFFYRPGYTAMGFPDTLGWFFSLLTGAVLLTWLYNSAKGSILICAIFHSTIDIAFMADHENKDITNYMGFLITIWGILAIIILRPKNFSGNNRQTNSPLEMNHEQINISDTKSLQRI